MSSSLFLFFGDLFRVRVCTEVLAAPNVDAQTKGPGCRPERKNGEQECTRGRGEKGVREREQRLGGCLVQKEGRKGVYLRERHRGGQGKASPVPALSLRHTLCVDFSSRHPEKEKDNKQKGKRKTVCRESNSDSLHISKSSGEKKRRDKRVKKAQTTAKHIFICG